MKNNKCSECNKPAAYYSIRCRKCFLIWHSKNHIRGEQTHNWLGDKASYTSIHNWVYKWFGQQNICENKLCNKKCNYFEWANISGKYKRERSDWIRLCSSCHRKMDYNKIYGEYCKKGHKFDIKNTKIDPKSGKRRCIKCTNALQRRLYWRKKKANER